MPAKALLIILIFLAPPAISQYKSEEKRLLQKESSARSATQKIKALGQLAEIYYIYRADEKADSVLQKQLATAEIANDKELILEVLFNNSLSHIEKWSGKETFDRALSFIDKGLAYAKEAGRKDYEVMAYLRKATIYRKRGQHDNAMREISLAFSSSSPSFHDSLKIAMSLEMGDISNARGDAVAAYKNYNNAYDIAYTARNIPLRSQVYHHFAALYQKLGDMDLAKKAFISSLQLNQENKNLEGLVADYIGLARITDEKLYIDKAIALADSLKLPKYQLYSKRLLLAYLMVIKKDSKSALNYLNNHADIIQFYMNQGISNYYHSIGNIFHYSGQADSAIHYYKLAEPQFEKTFDQAVRMYLYNELGDCYSMLNENKNAQIYFEKALVVGKELNELSLNANILSKLSSLFAKTGDYQKAYERNQEYIFYKDTLQKMSAERDLVILELEREKARHEKDLAKTIEEGNKRTNLQYLAISIAITLVFIIIMIMGMFPVSRIWFRIVSFFSFICLFEFIILLIDSWLHQKLHGDALKIWMVKIGLLAILLPLHHYLEHVMVHFLESQKLIRIRERFSLKNLGSKPKKPISTEQGTI
jgi:tetratricopeptide (TPR) repeat protein